ncbi:MAG: hypothetical protein H6975_03930 [Gammaproteobacteria bacterium]|nr:hypothetical protein [Gammaproteobacteria bacterium]
MAILKRFTFLILAAISIIASSIHSANAAIPIAQSPLFFPGTLPPINMLVVGRDHTLYYEAYNDASDLNGDGVLDVGYKPNNVTYFGYFDSHKCYAYNSSDGRFNPVSTASNKKCSGQWSGDFLNYVTTARVDALRKVLYGGHRVVDDEDLTILERSYVPQDAHSWGKEYRSISHDGYDIREYTPLTLPTSGTRHLFANTTLLKTGNKEPLMRVLTNSNYRIWEWVAIERPVAGDQCLNGGSGPNCETSASTVWEIVPSTVLQLTQTVYKITSGVGTHPSNSSTFDTLVTNNAITANLCGSQAVTTINGSGNPFSGVNGCSNDNYLNIFTGQITIDEAGTYTFSVDGDDAVDLQIDGVPVASYYGGHGSCGCNTYSGAVTLSAGTHTVRFRHEEASGGDSYYLRWQRVLPSSARTDYTVRIKVCDANVGVEANCKEYPSGHYKPTGLLHDYGETDRMLFGLITGAYNSGHNLAGGVLRKNIESFQDEINPDTGQLTNLVGIVRTLDRLRIVDFNMNQTYQYNDGWLVTGPLSTSSSRFPDWGNPIGEMMYESLRYFSGKTSATSDFLPSLTSGMERVLLRDYVGNQYMYLPAPAWKDPYTRADDPRPYCSAGAQLVISDINPSYDTDKVPGSYFSTFTGDISGLNATNEADAIWAAEHGGSSQHFIGQSGTNYDGAPSVKTVTGLGNIRGLSPSEPTKEGGYYSAAIAKYAYENDLRTDLQGEQKVQSFSVALASPLPKIEIPVGSNRVTLVPFAKSVGGWSGLSAAQGNFQPTNTIVDFFVEKFANTDPLGSDADASVNSGRPFVKFRINYEDVEQGADHDMDAIVVYEARANADNTLTVDLTSEYAAGSIIQHMGYVISGTTADGTYLEVRDYDTGAGSDPSYFLNTPPGLLPGACASSPPAACSNALPLFASRTFTPSNTGGATLLKDPLWYAAKYGSDGNEALAQGETSPNYFLVTNASTLQAQLENAFQSIIGVTTSASAVATNSTQLNDGTVLYQARFNSDDWTGELRAFSATAVLSGIGATPPLWDAGTLIPAHGARNIFTANVDPAANPRGVPFQWTTGGLDATQKTALNIDPSDPLNNEDGLGETRLNWLRGDASQEQKNSGPFRNRSRVLGDIVNFNPVLVRADYFGYERLPTAAGGDTYLSFYNNNRHRRAMVYVGANDGMLHAFDAANGDERFAYVPNLLIPQLNQLTDPAYTHRYYIDGQAFAGDAYLGGAWKTILVSTLGAGGRGVFALDVTDPDAFDASKVLWEFTDPDLGYVIGEPQVVRMANGEWAAVFGNGYNSDSQQAYLFIVNLATGALIKKIPTGVGSGATPNGLAPPALLPDNTGTITAAYAGDLLGNLWKFDLSATTPGATADTGWRSAFVSGTTPEPLFTAINPDDEPQPITARPEIVVHPDGGYVILFGTGRYFAANDNVIAETNEPVQSLYGVRDNSARVIIGSASARASVLQEQTILAEPFIDDVDQTTRVLSANTVDWTSKEGWFLDLVSPVNGREGERVTLRPVIRRDRAIFTTRIPSEDPCVFGGDGWVMEIDALSGARVDYALFDINADSLFDEGDFVQVEVTENGVTETISVPVSGLKVAGIPALPTIIRDASGVEVRLISTTATTGESSPQETAAATARANARTAAEAAQAAAEAAAAAADAAAAHPEDTAAAAAAAAAAAEAVAKAADAAAAAAAVVAPTAATGAAAAAAAAATAATSAASAAAQAQAATQDPSLSVAQAASAAAVAAAEAAAAARLAAGSETTRISPLQLGEGGGGARLGTPSESRLSWRQVR